MPVLKEPEEFYIYKRHLPHWRLTEATYFVTWRLHQSRAELSPVERDLVASAIRHFEGERYDLAAFVVMNDHVHVILKPMEMTGTEACPTDNPAKGSSQDHSLQKILHSWKSFTANKLQKEFKRKGSVWQNEFFDRIIRDEKEYWEKDQYILNNPMARWPERDKYPWVWAVGYEGGTSGTGVPAGHDEEDTENDDVVEETGETGTEAGPTSEKNFTSEESFTSAEGTRSKVRLKTWNQRKHKNMGFETPGDRPIPSIDQIHRLMHLWKAGDVIKVDEYLDRRAMRKSNIFHQLLQALIELAPTASEERSLMESLSNHLAGSKIAAPKTGLLPTREK